MLVRRFIAVVLLMVSGLSAVQVIGNENIGNVAKTKEGDTKTKSTTHGAGWLGSFAKVVGLMTLEIQIKISEQRPKKLKSWKFGSNFPNIILKIKFNCRLIM